MHSIFESGQVYTVYMWDESSLRIPQVLMLPAFSFSYTCCSLCLPSQTNTHHRSMPLFWHALELCVRFLSRCAAAFMADWEQQVWLCKSKVSLFLSLLSLVTSRSQKYRILLWKVQFATGIALPFQHDLSLISGGRSELWHEWWKWVHSLQPGFSSI